ncbi:TonB-dependent receptor [Luteimonas sp. S4-F44]|uniref:TonB-dependent receptor plug domain-containing protein n=1 Tax=Luteimonas sp. S4-F44 TaxID=2925842 RepID=UPI001F52C7CE|nr:TonB-dependent receptor [Luteimonas sp. S4-F44]UNK42902.1 TonB-dependent receptor [Luteimonas sp. S4-F44]
MNLRTSAIRKGLLPAAIVFALAPAAASAQNQTQGTTELDRIQVTGSRIRKVDVENAQPIQTISRTNIENQGFQSVGDILQNIAATGSPSLSRSNPLASGESPGGTFVDLRNLGPERTLVLLNGRRLGVNNDGLQDLATIPSSMVERIEVLKDGASSLYGSDAVAGVINVITRRNFDGAEANAYYGQYGEGDGAVQSFDFTIGSQGERSSIVFGAQYDKEDPVFAKDRPFSRFSYPGQDESNNYTTVGAIGNIRNPNGPGWLVLRDGGDPTNLADYRPQVNPGDGVIGDTSNAAEQMMVKTGMERTSIFTSADFDLTDKLRLVTDASFNRRETSVQVAGYPLQSGAVDVQTPISADSYFNPTGATLDFRRRGWEVPRTTDRRLDTYRFSAALEGSFEVGEKFFDWDAGYLFTRGDSTIRGRGDFNKLAVRQAVGPSFLNDAGVVQCGTPDAPIALADCTPWSPVLSEGPYSLANPDIQRRFFLMENATSETTTHNYFANVSGSIVTMPAGELSFAAGLENRRVKGRYSPDAFAQTGNSTNLAAQETSGGYSVNEAYLELDIPLLADVPGAQELALNVASRYSDYDVFGDTTNSKASFRWRPIDDLLVRGTWAEGFRAPAVSDLYGGVGQTFDRYVDPCDTVAGAAANNPEVFARCAADIANYEGYRQRGQGGTVAYGGQTGTPFLSGSNPDLTPETSVSRSLGLVYSPQYVNGLGVSLDWWKTKIDNVVTAFTASGILADCYIYDISSQCDYFTRDETTGTVDNLTRIGRNAGYWEIEGYDLEVNYALPETAFGNFGVNWATTYYSNFEIKSDSTDNTTPQPQVGFGGSFRIRSVASLNWDYGDFGATWTARYFSGVKEECYFDVPCNLPDYIDQDDNAIPQNKTGSNTFNDVQIRWKAPWNATVSIGVNNVFDRVGPLMYTQPSSGFSYQGSFDIGRFTYMKYQQRF